MKDLLDEMAGDSEKSLDIPENSQLGSIAKIAEEIIAQETLVDSLENDLKEAKKKLLDLTDNELPAAMQELNMSAFSMGDGSQVTLEPTCGARIPTARKDEAYEWLRQHGEADIIKNTVTVRFNREQDNEANALVDDLMQRQFMPEQKSEIHPGTLRSWAKGRIEDGKELPMDMFGVWVGQRAKIKRNENG